MNICTKILQPLLAQPCALCGAGTREGQLCADCRADLPLLPEHRCPGCALPSPAGELCGACLKHPRPFDGCEAVYRYGFPLDALIQHCKYGGAQELTELFAEALAERLSRLNIRPDVLIPMPLHPTRLGERGFNQAMEIARRLGRRLDIPVQHACQRLRNTPPQAGLDLRQRKRNLRGAFVCEADLGGQRIALLDDVMTSGSSLDELARVARRAGAVDIRAWVVARTLAR